MIVITGAGGHLGRLIAAAIAKRGAVAGVTLGTRAPEKIAEFTAQGFKAVPIDFDQPQSLRAAFADAATVLLISTDTLDSESRIRQHRAAVDAARQAAVKRIVYTSFVSASPTSHFPAATVHAATESYLKTGGVGYTILQVNQYFENLDGSLAQAKSSGSLVLPGAKGKVAYIARADVADAATSVLFGDGHLNKTYTLTGPEALDLEAVAAALAVAIKKPVAAIDAAPDTFGKQLASFGIPAAVVEQLLGLCAATAAGDYAAVSADASRLAGHPLTLAPDYMKKFA